jgi:DtxR family transcriptional regulator, Mn-dependent transcriptional regulator
MNYPSTDPHGEVIPDARGFRESEDYVSLAQAEKGRFTIRKVINASPELLTYLNQESLVPGQSLTVLETTPFQGPLKLQIRGKNTPTYVGHAVANCIFVCRATNGNRRPHGSKRTPLALAGKKRALRKEK